MKLLLTIVIITVIALIGSRLTFLNRKLPLGFRNIFFTGTEYIFIGVLLGKMGLNLIDPKILSSLAPFLFFGLSWIGFLFGLQFEFKSLKNLPRFFFSISAIQALFTFLVVTPIIFFSFRAFSSLPPDTIWIISLALGSASVCSAQSALAIVYNNYKFNNRKVFSLLHYISGIDGIFALAFFSITFFVFPLSGSTKFNLMDSLQWLLLASTIGILAAFIFIILSKTRFSQQEFIVIILGTVLFGGGLAMKTNNSPLFIGFIFGLITANFCRHRLRALEIMVHSEKSIYIILLVIIGAAWKLNFDFILIITGFYFLSRLLGKLGGVWLASRSFKSDFHIPWTAGLGLLSEGGFAVAIIISFSIFYPSLSDYLVTVVILSMIFNEIISPKLILSQLEKPKPIDFSDQPKVEQQKT
ncbi:MAG: cation:proton antiporter [Acidobacteriota bacterium]